MLFSARHTRFTQEQHEKSYLIHKRKLSEISSRKYVAKASNHLQLEQFRKNQLILSRKCEIRKWENIFEQNEKLLFKLNNVTSFFKRSNSRQSVQSNRSSSSRKSKSLNSNTIQTALGKKQKPGNKSLQIQKIDQFKLLSFPDVRSRVKSSSESPNPPLPLIQCRQRKVQIHDSKPQQNYRLKVPVFKTHLKNLLS